jgi:hypothetical protein
MKKDDHVLVLVVEDSNQLFLHADAKGLDMLIKSLELLRSKIDQGECDHDHMMTESWGEGSLTEDLGCETQGNIIHHLKIYAWTEEWAKKHGFK